jgi:diguanylate cyclase (GGDEF)-like protein
MQIALALNAIFGSALIVVLIFVNYIRKFNTDRFLCHVFCCLLIFSFISMMADLAYLLLEGRPGDAVYFMLYVTAVILYFFEMLTYYYIIIFIDYMVFKKRKRAGTITVIVYVIAIVYAAALALNLWHHFYFYISKDGNLFNPGDKYYIRLLLSYCPALFAVYDFLASHTVFRKSFLVMMIMLLIFPLVGSTADLVLGSVKLIWPCLTAALLYAYFFIIKSDVRIDSLTGIGNRFSFNEFTDKLSRRTSGESWDIVMIDMDNFKKINDTLGHQEGDNALRDMANIIRNRIRSSDFAARYGGDEFVLATRMENGAANLMRRIQEAVDQHNAKHIRPFKLEISYGHDVYTADGSRKIEEFLAAIDGLMYRHKAEHRRSGDKKTGAVT